MARMGLSQEDLMILGKQRKQLFETNILNNDFTEIIHLFNADEMKRGQIKVAFSEMLCGDGIYYTPEEYILHLEHLIELLGKYDHFHIHLIQEEAATNDMVYVKEEIGAIVAKTSAPPVVLAINESNLTAAFWDFLRILPVEKACSSPDNAETAKKLSAYIGQLQKSLLS